MTPSKSPVQSSRMKLFSEVYGYGSNPLLAGGGGGPAGTAAANSDGGWRPSGGNSKQKSNIIHQKALLDEQVKDDWQNA